MIRCVAIVYGYYYNNWDGKIISYDKRWQILSQINLFSFSGEMSLQYMIRIREEYITYRNGIACDYHRVPCDCTCHRSARSVREDPCMQCKAIHDAKKKFKWVITQSRRQEVSHLNAKFEPPDGVAFSHMMFSFFSYEPVRDIALSIIQEIQTKFQEQPVTALIALEAVLSELCSQRPADFNHTQ